MFDSVNMHMDILEKNDERILLLEKSDKGKLESLGALTQKFADISSDFTRVEDKIMKLA